MEKEIALIDREGNKLIAYFSIDWDKKKVDIIHKKRYSIVEDKFDVNIDGYNQIHLKGEENGT